MKDIGFYIHIPFCDSKCPYCDFYSRKGTEQMYEEYTEQLIGKIHDSKYAGKYAAKTLYFGGGTPGIIGAQRIGRIISAVKESFFLDTDKSEVTVELNPGLNTDYYKLRENGVNRISFGLQSAVESELELLGRRHSSIDAEKCVDKARSEGFDNISLDIMTAVPGQTEESLKQSIRFCTDLKVQHISAYILKIEPGTVFYKKRAELSLPEDDETATLYECLCTEMKKAGYRHYEISNFCRPGYESRHNLLYWRDEEYLGLGASAHSFLEGKRFYYPRSMQDFYDDNIIDDGTGGDEDEYIMLALRLAEGVSYDRFEERFGYKLPEKYIKRCVQLEKNGYIKIMDGGFSLTEKGFLVSNAVIAYLLS